MFKKTSFGLTAFTLAAIASLPLGALAAEESGYTPPTIGILTPTTTSVQSILAKIIGWILLFAGAIAVLFIIYAGILYMTANGNKERAEAAKKTLTYAVLGLIVIILADFIVQFVDTNLKNINKQPASSYEINTNKLT